MMSNAQIRIRLKELGWNPPTINENNRMYGLALIYNAEIDKNMYQEIEIDTYEIEEKEPSHNDHRLISPNRVCQLNWTHYFENTKQNIETGLRYAITQWEGDDNDIVVEFKRMRLSQNPDEDERILQIQSILENMLDYVCTTELKYNETLFFDDVDENELVRLSNIYEKEYYGYISDTELVEAMDRLLDIFNAVPSDGNVCLSPMVCGIPESPFSSQNNQMDQCQDEDSDEYY